MGTVIANTDPDGLYTYAPVNTVYRNLFDSLTYGTYALDANYGLNIACNNFANNYTDILVGSDDIGTYIWQGVSSCGSPTQPAANTFSGSTYNIVDNIGWSNTMTYYYSMPDSAGEVPDRRTGYVNVFHTYATNACAPTYGIGTAAGGGFKAFAAVRLDQSTLQACEQAFLTAQQTWQDSLASERGKMDLGNTDSMLSYVDTSTDTSALYNTFVAASPYVSEAALIRTATNRALSRWSMSRVLEHNPDLIRDSSFYASIDNIYSFTSYQRSRFQCYRHDSVTTRTVIEDSIRNASMEMGYYANLIMFDLNAPGDTNVTVSDTTGLGICTDSTSIYYTLDSNSTYSNSDSIDAWLQHIGGLWTYYARAGYYNEMQQYKIADSIMNNLPGQVLDTVVALSSTTSLPTSIAISRPVIATMSNIWNVIYNAETNGWNIYDLDSADIANLDTTSIPAYTDIASVLTLNLTNIINVSGNFGSILVIPCIQRLHERKSHVGGNGSQSSVANASPFSQLSTGQLANGEQFAVFPNPTNGIVTFAYNIPDAGGDVRIVIANVIGEQQTEIHTGNDSGTAKWNPSNLPSGIYIYQASAANGIISTGKIVIEK